MHTCFIRDSATGLLGYSQETPQYKRFPSPHLRQFQVAVHALLTGEELSVRLNCLLALCLLHLKELF